MRCFAVPVPALLSALACAAIAPAMTACATTTGLAWVQEPESGVDLTPPVSPSQSERPVSLPEQAPPRRRLDHAITLGGASEFDTGSYGTPAQPVDARAPTIVNVYITPGAMPYYGASYGYGGYGFGPSFVGSPVVRTVGQPAAAVMRPGLDWPAVPSHGPSFPYRTVPASPWESDGSRRR